MLMSTAVTSNHVKDIAFGDLPRELEATRRVLERLPEEHFAWKPHEKSMAMGRLAMHVATLPQWMLMTIEQDELDFASPPNMRTEPKDRADLLKTFDDSAKAVTAAMQKIDDAGLEKTWTLRNGLQVLHRQTKAMILRVWCINHLVNHRGQLCLYLRLLNVPVPAVYFNSADEPDWKFD
jgi:uncharacterized damage-inducible protein DinB